MCVYSVCVCDIGQPSSTYQLWVAIRLGSLTSSGVNRLRWLLFGDWTHVLDRKVVPIVGTICWNTQVVLSYFEPGAILCRSCHCPRPRPTCGSLLPSHSFQALLSVSPFCGNRWETQRRKRFNKVWRHRWVSQSWVREGGYYVCFKRV